MGPVLQLLGRFAQEVPGLWGFKYDGFRLLPNFMRPLAAKLCVESQNVSEMQKRVRSRLSPCQFLLAFGFRMTPGEPKMLSFFCLCVCRSRSSTTKFDRTTLPRRRWNLEVIFISLDMGSTEHFQRLFCN